MILLLAFLIGIIAGLRSLTAPMTVSAGARFGHLSLAGTPLAFLASPITLYSLVALALGELLFDQSPKAPSRKAPGPFIARIVTGGLSGGAIGAAHDALLVGLVAGAVGGVAGTLGGAAFRSRLAAAFGNDTPAAFIESGIAVIGGFGIVWLA